MKHSLFVLLLTVSFIQSHPQSIQDSVDLESFLDGVIATQMSEHHIAGAALSVVRNGKMVLAKGYGFSDVENQSPVDPQTTLFRIGSNSKLFVWVSIMQLVAQGKLDLSVDINIYLKDFKIPEKYGQPVTLKNLMTHTPGFEDKALGLFAKDSTKLLPLGTILKNELPQRVRPPYTQASYSNHGTGMAAYIVEQVTGMSFNDYVEKNIIGPLNMKYTSFRQPLPPALLPHMSKGYSFKNSLVEQDFEYVPLYPVGAASASAADMTHFMLAFLQQGTYNNYTMLDSATFALMKSPAHRHHQNVNSMRYGLMDLSQNGVTIIGHGGDTFWFHSLTALLPDYQTGLFLAFNTDEAGGAYLDVLEAFMDHYFPDTVALTKPMEATAEWLSKFEGEYRGNRYVHSDILKIGSLFGRLTVSAKDSTRLALISDEETVFYVPLDSTTFREEFKSDRIAFKTDENGNITHLFLGLLPIFALEKVSGTEASGNHTLIFFFVATMTLVTLLFWPLVAVIRRRYKPGSLAKLTLPGVSKAVAWMNFLFFFVFLLGMALSFGDPIEVVYGVPASVKILLMLPMVMMATTLGMIFMSFGLLRSKRYSLRSRIFYLVLCFTSLLALWQLNYWNFVGYNF